METKPKERGNYKKHKEGFKIAVEYKLNTKLKGFETFDGQNLYPVYVEVRARRKRHYFPSFYVFYVLPEEFEKFKANELVKTLFENESSSITNFVTEYYSDVANKDNNWYESYRILSANENIYHHLRRLIELKLEYASTLETFDKNRIIDVVLFGKGEYVQNTLDLLVSMKIANSNPVIQELIDILRTYLRIKEFISLYSREWLSPDLQAIFYLEYSISLSVLLENKSLRQKIQLIGYEPIRFFSDVEILREFENSVEMFI